MKILALDLSDCQINLSVSTILICRAHAGEPSGSPYVQLFSKYLRENYMKRPLDRIYLMVKQAMETVVQHRTVLRVRKEFFSY